MSSGRTVPTRSHGLGKEGVSTTGASQVEFGDPELTARINDAMVQVEELLHTELSSGEDFLVDIVMHLTRAGGKRFRPMFALLASEFGEKSLSENVIKAAVVVEITHLATLYHDDVMDEASMRRGVPSANARWDNSVAILAGDILLAHASGLMSQLGTDTVAHFAETFGELVTGQMRETVGPRDTDPIEHYTNVIREKTGVLIASAGYLGAMHAGAAPEHIDALKNFGAAVGMIFQIVDDIIDIFSETHESGKTPGTDLREGVFTLPVLYALREDTPVGAELRDILTGPLEDDETVNHVLELLSQSGGRQAALDEVYRYMDIANAELDRLPDSTVKEALRNLATFTVKRVG
ncbi:polyprenyl synthetase family protein [Corynebacterium glutamicum]|uniref:polyprenyl synthetase family protein n=1 Tax=Corynebacterium TaxID=1716 RepID=UPI00071F19E7|nr:MULTISPECIES: polyprenyl synthetase family protein [Corynebacterium]ALP49255.1 geranylgeranyl pyrophosphate synthase [Corynebacterium glutamicum]ANR61548.1 octaprenyl-diphosphate synthase [[Brevibacterium] flavum ZL-1]ANR64547.1 octaprenyl-diphosphate synthase [Corynebacterium glutamicum ZL-6]ANU32764.1 geranylgeranyl pyrophosphate synthase [Corynebacterium glutamicum]APT06510.1 geranylgeranyl pyrophosphate synthase [Corynebacterium glutamicum]